MNAVQILAGPELGRRNDTVDEIRATLRKEWGEAPEEHRCYFPDTAVGDILSLLMNGSLFSAGKLVSYFGVESIKTKADVQALVGFIKKPSERTVLLLVTENFGVDKNLEEAVGKAGKKIFWELSESEKHRWILDYFKREAVSIESDAVDSILEIIENNTDALRTECSRLAMFVKRGGTVTVRDIESYIARNREEDAFSLFDCMASGNLEQSLGILDAILRGRESGGIGVLGGILWSFRRLLKLHGLMAEGDSFENAARSLRITSRKLLATHDAAIRRWPLALCRALIAFGVDTDARLRTFGQAYERIFLELFLYGAITKRSHVEFSLD